jgi:hypothetical protein
MPIKSPITMAGMAATLRTSGAAATAASATSDDNSKPGKKRRIFARLAVQVLAVHVLETVNIGLSCRATNLFQGVLGGKQWSL